MAAPPGTGTAGGRETGTARTSGTPATTNKATPDGTTATTNEATPDGMHATP